METSRHEAVNIVIQTINRVWLNGQVEALAPMVDPDIVMVFPNFTGRIQGREQFLAGFRDFCENAKVHEFHDHDYQSDLVGDTAVVTFRYDMIYERSGEQYRASGRDLWVFRSQRNEWIAVWRTMLEMHEQAAE
jgi:ketosteroid isomerase-like protein